MNYFEEIKNKIVQDHETLLDSIASVQRESTNLDKKLINYGILKKELRVNIHDLEVESESNLQSIEEKQKKLEDEVEMLRDKLDNQKSLLEKFREEKENQTEEKLKKIDEIEMKKNIIKAFKTFTQTYFAFDSLNQNLLEGYVDRGEEKIPFSFDLSTTSQREVTETLWTLLSKDSE